MTYRRPMLDQLQRRLRQRRLFEVQRQLLVGGDGMPLETFLTTDPSDLF
ncbi:MAG: hypothetical protein AB1505_30550 [Candidatus Latescibacterota bacterium]